MMSKTHQFPALALQNWTVNATTASDTLGDTNPEFFTRSCNVAVPLRSEPSPVTLPFKEVKSLELSVVMPCLNEAETIESCVRKSLQVLEEANIAGEVIVADNGSTDGSLEIAEQLGVRVVHVQRKEI